MKRGTAPLGFRRSDGALALLLIASVIQFVRGAFPLNTADLFHTQFAAYEWHVGTPEKIYTTYEPEAVARWMGEWKVVAARLRPDPVPNLHFYPPFVSALLAPVADVPAAVWRDAVAALNFALMLALVWQILRLLRVPLTMRSGLWALTLVILAPATVYTVGFGQVSLLLAVLAWAGLLALRADRQFLGGGLIGLMATVKLTPLALLAFPAVRGRWKTCVAGVAVFGGVFALSWLLLGDAIHRQWWSVNQYVTGQVWVNALDHSPSGWYSRLVLGYALSAQPFRATPDIAALRIAVQFMFGAGSVLVLWLLRRSLTDDHFVPAVGLLICGVLLALPFMWAYYLVLPLPVLAWAIVLMVRDPKPRFWAAWLALTTVLFCIRFYRFYDDGTLGRFLSGQYTLAIALFWIWLARYLWVSSSAGTAPAAWTRPAGNY